MIELRFRHMDDPRPRAARKHAKFRTTYSKTLDLLEYELKRLQAKDVVIEAGYALSDIRNDGWPRSSSTPKHPAVKLLFISKNRPLSFPSDQYATMHQNLHAIALTLEALRAVDRHGVSQTGEQYTGWAQLAAPGKSDSDQWAATTILRHAGLPENELQRVLNDGDYRKDAYRRAVKRVHPEVPGSGDRNKFEELIRAHGVLDKRAQL